MRSYNKDEFAKSGWVSYVVNDSNSSELALDLTEILRLTRERYGLPETKTDSEDNSET